MKSTGLLVVALMLLMATISCNKDDAEPTEEDFISQNWVIDSYMFKNLPDDYSVWEDYEISTRFGEIGYELNMEKSKYTRGLVFQLQAGGDTTLTEKGEWTYADRVITFDPTGQGLGIEETFDVETITATDLVVKIEWGEYLYADQYATAAYGKYLDSLDNLEDGGAKYDSALNAIYKPITFDLILDFDLNN